MQLRQALSGLPTSLVLLISAQIQAGVAENEAMQHPTAIRKTTFDEGEMIFPEYYAFSSSDEQAQSPRNMPLSVRSPILTPDEEDQLAANSSAVLSFRPPFPIHMSQRPTTDTDAAVVYRRSRDVLARLEGRQFSCPEGTAACTNIGESGYCCQSGTTCFVVQDAPNAGNVGCCPDGNQCSGGVGDCGSGSTGCAAENGGGCCIEGFMCADAGCVASHQPTATKTTTTQKPPTTSTTSTTTTHRPTTTHTTTTTGDDGGALPPVRPTASSSSASDYCPTGYYACLAQDLYHGGCCRIGRDCATTSCPPLPPMTTITTDAAATVVVPVSDVPATTTTTTTASSSCAGGWYGCGRGLLGGCCPSGYACGSASCTLTSGVTTATATVEVQKVRPGQEGGAAAPTRGANVWIGAVIMGVAVGWGLL